MDEKIAKRPLHHVGSANQHPRRQTKAEILERQEAEAKRMLHSDHRASGVKMHHNVPPISFFGFAIAALAGILISFGLSFEVPILVLFVYMVIMMAIAITAFLELKGSTDPHMIWGAAFAFSAVSILGVWSIIGGAISAPIVYLVMTHELWVE